MKKKRYVVDTNVLIAASAADTTRPRDIDAAPDDPALRKKVWEWLNAFKNSTSRLILDDAYAIFKEYRNKLTEQDFGIQVVIHKWNTNCADSVRVDFDADGNVILPSALVPVIHDLADRKMVAAALASRNEYGQGCVAFASDSDWHGWEAKLKEHGVELEPIIEEWSRKKYEEKLRKKARQQRT